MPPGSRIKSWMQTRERVQNNTESSPGFKQENNNSTIQSQVLDANKRTSSRAPSTMQYKQCNTVQYCTGCCCPALQSSPRCEQEIHCKRAKRVCRCGQGISTIQFSKDQYNTVQYSTPQCSAVPHSAVQHRTVQYTVQNRSHMREREDASRVAAGASRLVPCTWSSGVPWVHLQVLRQLHVQVLPPPGRHRLRLARPQLQPLPRGATGHKLQVTSHKSRVASHKSQAANHRPQAMNHKMAVTSHTPLRILGIASDCAFHSKWLWHYLSRVRLGKSLRSPCKRW